MMERAESGQKLYTRMRLWEFPDQFVVEPTDGSSGSALAISRADGSMNLIHEVPECSILRVPKIRTIFGVVGVLKLLAGSYLIVITERECVGSYLGHPIYKVASLKILPCDHSLNNSSAEQKKVEAEFSCLLKLAERTPGLYFSYDTNLTLSVQRLNTLGDESKLLPLWRQAEPRFLWNNYLMEALIDNKLDPFLLPVIQGSILMTLLASAFCPWTRMWRRGADSDGYVANFVETEQVVQMNGFMASFVQVRGSIPFLWEQTVDLTYKPKFEILRAEEAHGGEGRLCENFGNAMQNVASDDIRYLHFDFHRICGHVHFERLSILFEQIEDFLEKNGYLLLNEKGEKMKEQCGVVRTNCIDCLDRTNVTQSMIGRNMLEVQLRRIGIFGAEETINSHPNFDENFKILWANHGDDISLQYSGTPALKGDFVRCGQRTMQGILNDGWNALARYYLNNFCDGTKQASMLQYIYIFWPFNLDTQDAIDLLQGHYIVSVSRDIAPRSQSAGLEAMASFPLALSLVLTGLFFATLSLRQGESGFACPNRFRYDLKHLLFSVIWASLSIALAAFVRANGRLFCNRPRLHKPQR
ncbi:phosphoinositide phosphatase SAC6 [Citrus sinensis]|uniref:Phosphoinositide phosphatase SAC6 n=1 Tax=Citrus sinensis TaxID=2711 RepID=A0ACB8IZA1_CITSI|nr:phosphoinositide phosphatase SAC6 [Citrus sinensis]